MRSPGFEPNCWAGPVTVVAVAFGESRGKALADPCGQPLAGIVALLQSTEDTVFDPEGVAQSQRGVGTKCLPLAIRPMPAELLVIDHSVEKRVQTAPNLDYNNQSSIHPNRNRLRRIALREGDRFLARTRDAFDLSLPESELCGNR
jgi:hypothetical protein